MDTNNKKVYELRIKVYIIKDIPLWEILAKEAEYIDSALAQSEKWLEHHETNRFKNYCFGGLYPIEKDPSLGFSTILFGTFISYSFSLASINTGFFYFKKLDKKLF